MQSQISLEFMVSKTIQTCFMETLHVMLEMCIVCMVLYKSIFIAVPKKPGATECGNKCTRED